MIKGYYRTSEFAGKVNVSVRTLRYYDRQKLLSPSRRSDAGYRLYTDEDVVRLQHILGLKFLGFSLAEIRACLSAGPMRLPELLSQQKKLMLAKQKQVERIIEAIAETESLLEAGRTDWDEIFKVIKAIQMEQKETWVSDYLTPEQQAKLRELADRSYSEEARRHLAGRGEWTQEDQQKVNERYVRLNAELKRIMAEGSPPSSPAAQAVAELQIELIDEFTQGNQAVREGACNFLANYHALPEKERPPINMPTPEELAFLQEAMTIRRLARN